jgi:hypothetical protein
MTKRLDPHPFRCARHAAPQCRKPGTRHRGSKGLSFRRVIPGRGFRPRARSPGLGEKVQESVFMASGPGPRAVAE